MQHANANHADNFQAIMKFSKEAGAVVRVRFIKADDSERTTIVNLAKTPETAFENFPRYIRLYDEIQGHMITVHPEKVIEVNLVKA